ncbi:MarR family winged helix-turn-helix transcriptional regulator [Elstera sp.]|jgi:DNA-binding MarR family transcriptional regulator|uniref:MarR family winged helix-turn-helix transcriptional regulator n=1 Tax=Elstera sp. TaxID=1916664 RepID=UPI0037C17365
MSNEWLHLDNQLCFAVYSTSHAFTRVYKPLLDALGLTYPQYLVMMILWEQDGQTVGAVGERLFLESSTLTPLLKRLEAAGLVERRRSLEDQRQVRLYLTDAGQGLQTKAQTVPPCILSATGLEVPELAALKAEIIRLRASLAAAVESL